jgi:hypothetical protein
MKNRTFSSYALFSALFCLILFSACSGNPKLKVKGKIRNAEGKVLYFELFGMDKSEVLDSVILEKDGDYKFSTVLPKYPEFYRLRIENRFIHLGADSAAQVSIDGDGKDFGKNYTVKGSRCCELIHDLSLLQNRTLLSVDSLTALYNQKLLSITELQEKLMVTFDGHRKLAKKAIFENPRSPAAYFALFQRVHNYLIFDPYDSGDNKCFAAVATSWDTFYPKATRSKHIVNLTWQGLKEIRQTRDAKDFQIKEQDKISFFEIQLPNVFGKTIPLSALQGKVILLDFTAYQSEFSPSRNLYFRELYHNYAEQGFEIYQVSLDTDEQLWKTGAANLPWICVRDKRSVHSTYLQTYNIQNIPTYFLVDRSGNIVARDAMVNDLNKEILKLL